MSKKPRSSCLEFWSNPASPSKPRRWLRSDPTPSEAATQTSTCSMTTRWVPTARTSPTRFWRTPRMISPNSRRGSGSQRVASPRIAPGSFDTFHASCVATELHCAAFTGTDGALENMVNLAEVDEVFMANQNAGWNCGAINEEALSRVLATARYPASLNSFASGASWLDSSWPNRASNTSRPTATTCPFGCATLDQLSAEPTWVQLVPYRSSGRVDLRPNLQQTQNRDMGGQR